MTSPPEHEDAQERTPDTDTSRRPSESVDPSLRVRMQRSVRTRAMYASTRAPLFVESRERVAKAV